MSTISGLKEGLVGGFFATVVMTIFREPTARSLPPTAELIAQYTGGDPEEYHVSSLTLHGLYGIVGGALFSLLFGEHINETSEPETVGLIAGAVYGTVSSLFGERVVLRHVLGMDLETDESAIFHTGHLIYGLALGAWIGSRHE